MSGENTYTGSCFCGAVELTLVGEPITMGYCHFGSCRHWSASPVSTYTLWSPESMKITKGADNISTYIKTQNSFLKWCKTCGGHLFTEHPAFGFIDVNADIIPDLPFKPEAHLNYQETVLPIKDGVPKLKDMPKEAGGSGDIIPE
ncbi:MAG: GFA family protein [Deltaproteobacteria bacterium]